jgi:hypothetical protein
VSCSAARWSGAPTFFRWLNDPSDPKRPMPPCLRPHAIGHFGQSARHDPNDPKAGRPVLELGAQCSSAACPRWRAHRLACHDLNDPTPARRAHRRSSSSAASWRAGGARLRAGAAGWRPLAAGRWHGGGRARGHPVKITGSVRKKFFIFFSHHACRPVLSSSNLQPCPSSLCRSHRAR